MLTTETRRHGGVVRLPQWLATTVEILFERLISKGGHLTRFFRSNAPPCLRASVVRLARQRLLSHGRLRGSSPVGRIPRRGTFPGGAVGRRVASSRLPVVRRRVGGDTHDVGRICR